MAKRGRPTEYTDELAETICQRVAEGWSLRQLDAADDVPSLTTIMRWRREKEDFRQRYTRAREESAIALEDRAFCYCDRLEQARTVTEVQGLKEAAAILRWAASVRAPKTHGDLTKLQHSGADGEPLRVVVNMPGGADGR